MLLFIVVFFVFYFSAYVLFIVDAGEINRMDQLWLEREMFNINRHSKVIYRTLTDVGMNGVSPPAEVSP
jgi:hypothetical protein